MRFSFEIFFIIVFFFLFIAAIILNLVSNSLNKKFVDNISDKLSETKTEIKQYKNVFSFFSFLIVLIYVAYYFTAKYHVESHVMEWLNLIVRWEHVVFGIAWIVASFYYIFLECSLNRTENLRY